MPNEKQQLLTLHKRHSGFKTQKSEGKKKWSPKTCMFSAKARNLLEFPT